MTQPQRTIRPAPVRKTIEVAVGRERAFQVFTTRIGRWWPRTHTVGSSPQADVVMEPFAGGRWYERGEDGAECAWGEVLAYDPPQRLLLAWRIDADFKPNVACQSEVEVLFHALGPTLTRVEIEHRKLEAFGDKAEEMRAMFDGPNAWTKVLETFAAEAQGG